MKSRWIWGVLVALASLAVYVGNGLATPQTPSPGFAGKTLAMATFGEIDSHVQSEPNWQEKLKIDGPPCVFVFNREGGIARKFAEIKVDYADVEKVVVELLKK